MDPSYRRLSSMQATSIGGIFKRALTSALKTKSTMHIEPLSEAPSALRSHVFELLSQDNRSQAFDLLLDITSDTHKSEYIDSVLYASRYLLANNLAHECYMFLRACHERIESLYGPHIDYTLFEEIGNMFYLTGQFNEAIKWYKKLMEINEAPESKMYFSIGICNQMALNYSPAIECYLKSIAADPRYTKSLVNLGQCYLQLGNFEKALAAFQQLPLSSETLVCIGNTYFRMNNFEEAVAHYLRATEIKEDPGAYNNLGCALKKLNLFQDAIYAFNDSLALQPSSETVNNLITLYIELGKLDDAKNLIELSNKLLSANDLKLYSRYIDESRLSELRPTLVLANKSLLGTALKKNGDSRRSVLSSVTPSSRLTPSVNLNKHSNA